MRQVFVVTTFIAMFFSCGKTEGPIAVSVQLTGINGAADYVFDGKECMIVSKPEYQRIDYSIYIFSDTVELGQEFGSFVKVYTEKARIKIQSPTPSVVVFRSIEEESSENEYRFTPRTTGLQTFSGIVEYDSVTVPFSYNFIVIKKR